ncbi:MAG: preprotein translocase subunit SecG, partial [Methylosarcina sp.]
MYQVIIVFHVLLGLGIIGLVLMQQGKGADAGAAFGSGASGSVFGAQGAASFLSRSTAILATLFFLTSLGLAVLNSQKGIAYDLMSEPATSEETSTLPV